MSHSVIACLKRAGIGPGIDHTPARHSDIRLTLGIYTHVELHDQTAAIQSLPGPNANDSLDTPPKRLGIAG